MIYEIKNDNITLKVDTFGAEMHSLSRNNMEYIWQCGEAWKRYSPILFPFISSPKDHKYLLNGKEYTMKANHGFARDLEFELINRTSTELTFQLCSNDFTYEQYPFDFIFEVSYHMLANGVEIRHVVKNNSKETMYFYLGGHPAFRCPISPECEFSDYEVVFEKEEDFIDQNGQSVSPLSGKKVIQLSRSLFDQDVIMTMSESKVVTLRSSKSAHSITIEFPDADVFGLWSPKGDERASFVCLEPWTSLPVNLDDDEMDLAKKKHATGIAPSEKYHFNYRILVE